MQRIDRLLDLSTYVPAPGSAGFEFLELHPGGSTLPPPPLFLFGPASRVVTDELYGQFETPAVGCFRLEEAGVGVSGIPLQHDIAFTTPSLLHPEHLVRTVVGHMASRPVPERHVDGTVAVIYGPASENFGHWLIDFLPRLWVLAATGHDIARLSFAMPTDLDPIVIDMLSLLGVAPERFVRHDPMLERLTADVLLVPTGLRLGNRISVLFENATNFWTGRLRDRLTAKPSAVGRRVFLSRGDVRQQRVMVNRGQVEKVAEERGFAVVSPERLPLADQVALFTGASLIAGEYGSALHGSVFSAPGTVACGLRGNVRHPSFIQSGIGGALRQHTGYVLGDAPGQDVEQRFSIDLDDFERAIDIMEAKTAQPALTGA